MFLYFTFSHLLAYAFLLFNLMIWGFYELFYLHGYEGIFMEIQSSWDFVVKQLTCIYTLLLFVQMLDL